MCRKSGRGWSEQDELREEFRGGRSFTEPVGQRGNGSERVTVGASCFALPSGAGQEIAAALQPRLLALAACGDAFQPFDRRVNESIRLLQFKGAQLQEVG